MIYVKIQYKRYCVAPLVPRKRSDPLLGDQASHHIICYAMPLTCTRKRCYAISCSANFPFIIVVVRGRNPEHYLGSCFTSWIWIELMPTRNKNELNTKPFDVWDSLFRWQIGGQGRSLHMVIPTVNQEQKPSETSHKQRTFEVQEDLKNQKSWRQEQNREKVTKTTHELH